MKIKDRDSLTRMALSGGAVVKLKDGTVINPGRTRAEVAPRPKPEAQVIDAAPAPEPVAPAPPPSDNGDRLAAAVLAAVQQALDARPQVPASPPTAWTFTVERDRDGLLSKIVATPVVKTFH